MSCEASRAVSGSSPNRHSINFKIEVWSNVIPFTFGSSLAPLLKGEAMIVEKSTRNLATLNHPADLPVISSIEAQCGNILSVKRSLLSPGGLIEHSHNGHQIIIPLGQSFTMDWYSGRQHRMRMTDGEVCIMPAFQPHSSSWDNTWENIAVFIDSSYVTRVASEMELKNSPEIVEQYGMNDPMIKQIGVSLLEELGMERATNRLYVDSLINVLAVRLLKNYSTTTQKVHDWTNGLPKYKLRRVTDYINNNLENEMQLDELAALAQMSPYHFTRMFKQSTGLAPHQYIINCRIERSKQLLSERKLSIAEIAYHVGFASQSHFTTLFRKLTLMTPKSYRERQS